MGYINVVTLAQAKEYLRVDDDLTEDDAAITIMINSALAYIEKETRVFVFARDIDYRLINGCITIYDAPINSAVLPVEADLTIENYTLYDTYAFGSTNTVLTLNVGHVLPADVPNEVRTVALKIIDLLYYEKDTGKTFPDDMDSITRLLLGQLKRFVI